MKGPEHYTMMTSLRTIHKAVMGNSRKWYSYCILCWTDWCHVT
jgi:hypothetical protein